jgi:signal transduction histidine kinase
MKKHFKAVFGVAILTAASILIFQAFWVYKTYRASEANFHATLTRALQRSVDLYLLHQIGTPHSLSGEKPYLSIINNFSGDMKQISSETSDLSGNKDAVEISFQPLKINMENLESVQLFLAKMIALSSKQNVDLPVINSNFREELKRQKIDIDYKLYLRHFSGQKTEDKIAAYLGQAKGDWLVEARLFNSGTYLWAQNAVPAAISLLLILLTGGSLWYMGIIIKRQQKIDEQKNEFINNLTHELRTPISILKSTNEALLQFGEATNIEKTVRYLQINVGVLDNLDHNLDRLLNISRYELGAKTIFISAVNIPELINATVEKFSLNPINTVLFKSELKNELIYTDKHMMEAIVTNLVDNALKYSDPPSHVVIKAVTMPTGWQLEIRDNGHGIKEENLPMIFDKFYRVPFGDLHDVKGYGIGLSHVKQIVSLLSGDITVKSALGSGTTFIIKFPKYD